jgi:hypothetical protein
MPSQRACNAERALRGSVKHTEQLVKNFSVKRLVKPPRAIGFDANRANRPVK